jgi:iron(III) transport system ATP-binding protein
VVPQEGALFPHLSVGANVGFGLARAGRAGRVAECLELVGLSGTERARPDELSGGMQQRVALARALAPRPDLVLLDEPFSALDAGLRAQVRAEVCEVLRRAGATAVLVTHDQQEALSVADSVGVLLGGRVVQHADPVRLYREPVSLEVARFVGEAVVVAGRADAGLGGPGGPGEPGGPGGIDTPLGVLVPAGPGPYVGPVTVLVRPEQLVVAPTGTGVPARVVGRTFLGPDALVDLAVDGLANPVRARVGSWALPEPGATVGCTVAGPVAVFPA